MDQDRPADTGGRFHARQPGHGARVPRVRIIQQHPHSRRSQTQMIRTRFEALWDTYCQCLACFDVYSHITKAYDSQR